jgi:hypothetical protein
MARAIQSWIDWIESTLGGSRRLWVMLELAHRLRALASRLSARPHSSEDRSVKCTRANVIVVNRGQGRCHGSRRVYWSAIIPAGTVGGARTSQSTHCAETIRASRPLGDFDHFGRATDFAGGSRETRDADDRIAPAPSGQVVSGHDRVASGHGRLGHRDPQPTARSRPARRGPKQRSSPAVFSPRWRRAFLDGSPIGPAKGTHLAPRLQAMAHHSGSRSSGHMATATHRPAAAHGDDREC